MSEGRSVVPALMSITLPSGARFYRTPRGLVPSVTTVIRATRTPEEASRLQGKNGHRPSVQRRRLEARERGTIIHSLLRDAIAGKPVVPPPALSRYWGVCESFVDMLGKVYQLEVSGYHPALPYAGTPDLVAEWNGRVSVFDFKTGSYRKERQQMEEALLQGAAYRKMVNAQHGGGTLVSQVVILVILPNDMQVFRAIDDEADTITDRWMTRLQSFENLPLQRKLCLGDSHDP